MRQTDFIKNPPLFIAVGLSAFPIIMLVYLIHTYGVNVPVWDEWCLIPMFENYYFKELCFMDVWHQWSEHRLVFPKLIFLCIGVPTGFNVIYDMAVSVLLAFLMYLIMIRHINKNKQALQIERSYRWLWIIFSFFIFSLVQSENWLWGFQLQWFLNLLAVTYGAYIFANHPLTFFTVFRLAVCGVIATFSLSNGILYWVVILFFLLIYVKNHIAPHGLILIWLIISGGIFACYLIGYTPLPSYHLLDFMNSPLKFAAFILAYIGNPLSVYGNVVPNAIFFGICGLIIYISFLFHYISGDLTHRTKSRFFFLIIALYAVLSAVLTAIGRMDFGIWQATVSRYRSVSILFWISVFFMIYSSNFTDRISAKTRRVFLCFKRLTAAILLIAAIFSSYNSIGSFRQYYAERKCGQEELIQGIYGECFKKIYPGDEASAVGAIHRLKRFGLSVFKDANRGIPTHRSGL